MKIKTSELIGQALDWAVAKCEGYDVFVLTVEEQCQRWFQNVPPHEMDKEVAEFDEFIAALIKPKLAVLCEDGYKRAPTHEEAPMLFNAGPPVFQHSTSWAQGGPIIQQNGIGLLFDTGSACREPRWFATPDDQCTQETYEGEHFDPTFMVDESVGMSGPTPLIAAMRCYVASKLGGEVDVPEELLKKA